MNERVPAEVFPPGEFVKDELEARGWSQVDLAEILGRPPRLVSEIITGKRAITPETARGLSEAFGNDAQTWLNLESAYQLSRVAHRDDGVRRRARLRELLPVREIVQRGWIEATSNIDLLERRIMAFLGTDDLDAAPVFSAAARTSLMTPNWSQVAWLRRAQMLARVGTTPRYTATKLESAIERLRPLLRTLDGVREVRGVLADAGVRLVVVEHLPQTRIDGACFWLDAQSPAIALSLRHDRIDTFWFTLLHEIAHVRAGDGRAEGAHIDLDLADGGEKAPGEKSKGERAADGFASEFLLPSADVKAFIARARPQFAKAKIVAFAESAGVHAGVVVGRLQFLKAITYAHNREMLERVRGVVLNSVPTDGWRKVDIKGA